MNNGKMNIDVKPFKSRIQDYCHLSRSPLCAPPQSHPSPSPPRGNHSPDIHNNNVPTYLFNFTSFAYVPKHYSFSVAVLNFYMTRIILQCVCVCTHAHMHMSCFCCSTLILWNLSTLIHIVVHSFSLLCSIPLYGYTPIHLSILYMGCLGLL